jgi:hypothetical protein
MENPEQASKPSAEGGGCTFSLARLLGLVTLSALALGAAVQFNSALGFALLLVFYVALLIPAVGQLAGRRRDDP